MASSTIERPFRAHILFPKGLDQIHVVPLPLGDLPREFSAYWLRGRAELLAFIRAIPLDCVVQTEQVGDGAIPTLKRKVQVGAPECILAFIEARLSAGVDSTIRLLGRLPPQRRAPVHREDMVLGATTLEPVEGGLRARECFERIVTSRR